jgi:ArsR family transcriptional regulator, arsenate/arsenite/antimonite-responsive transcriptional repressor
MPNSTGNQSVFKALSDPTRREILATLRGGSRTAGELSEAFPITKASLSHHFGVLKAADLVRTDREGQHIRYSLNTTVFQDVASMLLALFGDGTADDNKNKNKNKKDASP